MKKCFSTILFITLSFLLSFQLYSQNQNIEEAIMEQADTSDIDFKKPLYLHLPEEEIINIFDKQPAFGMYRDNYIMTGIPTNKKITRHTADALFQISIQYRITKTILPWNTFLLLTYSQRSFGKIYESSSPFSENNYNPALLLGKPLIFKDELRGLASLSIEHESNGKQDTDSRSWNYIVLSAAYFFNINFSLQGKVWAGSMGDENKDLLRYRGYGLLACNYKTTNDKFWVSALIYPRDYFRGYNTKIELNYKINQKLNPYLFLQWYNGYGETLIDYKDYSSMVRVGICLKPPLRNVY
ncbi:MAG: phospholipase A [Candidatus Azobacteroides sp.]|nr:phospholipase A [Candidatus Azobacteroides sp.]